MDFSFDTVLRFAPRQSLTTQILGCVYLGILITGTVGTVAYGRGLPPLSNPKSRPRAEPACAGSFQ